MIKKEAVCASGCRGGVLGLTKPFTVEMMQKELRTLNMKLQDLMFALLDFDLDLV